jgi:two-component system chemotaxis response regulator CheB
VITLDLEMPKMNGLDFLARLMRHHPTPVIVVSSLAPRHSAAAVRALSLGAVDVIPKPGSTFSVPDVATELIRAIRAAACVRPQALAPPTTPVPSDALLVDTTEKVIAVGASTGGTRALEVLLLGMPKTAPGIAIAQHMPKQFTTAFAKRLDEICPLRVREAVDGDELHAGLALIAPGDRHMSLARNGASYRVQVRDGPPVNFARPSVDVLLESTAAIAGRNAVGVLLTGMGSDGARGLSAMRTAGAHTIAEDERTCVVFGMPRAAVELGAAVEVVELPAIAGRVLAHFARG